MNKVLIIGDMHMRYELPYSSSIKDGRRSEWENVKTEIINASKKCDEIVLLGDQLNCRHNHSSVLTEFVDFLKSFGKKKIHILIGNHCRYGHSTALDFLKKINKKNWHIYSEPTGAIVAGREAMMVPFMTPSLLDVENIEQGNLEILKRLKKADIMFAHLAVKGAKNTGFFNEIMLDKEVIGNLFNRSFIGHIHKKEKIGKNILITGSVFTNEIGEHEKSIFILDTATDTYEEIKLPVRGIFKIDWDKNHEKTLEKIPENSIVKCIITTRGTDIDLVKKKLKKFDASLLIEKYPSKRRKMHFDKGSIDFSIESLLKLYAKAKKIDYSELQNGFNLINNKII